MKNFIAVSGKARAGKDTFYSLAKEIYPFEVKRIALGDYVKEFAAFLFKGVLTGDKEIDREYFIRLGNGARDFTHPDVWCEAWRERCFVKELEAKKESPLALTILTDWRYPSEAEYFYQIQRQLYNGEGHFARVRIERSETSGIAPENATSKSETSLDNHWFNYEYKNDSSIDSYRDFVKKVVVKTCSGKASIAGKIGIYANPT